jgi:hypothetical protein
MLFRKNCQTVISLFPDAGPVDGLWLDSTPTSAGRLSAGEFVDL